MPHVNHFRGETGRFVFRREHALWTHCTCYKTKSGSNKVWKRDGNRIYRARVRQFCHRAKAYDAWDEILPPIDYEVRNRWDLW